MEINTDQIERRINAMNELCPYPNNVDAWVMWRMGFRHGGTGHPINSNGPPAYRDGYESGENWAKADQ